MSQDGYEAERECGYGVRSAPSEVDRLRAENADLRRRVRESERTLQRVREALVGAYDLGAIPREHVNAAMRILDEESGR